LERIKDFDEVNNLIEGFTFKNTLTNNYLLADQLQILIANQKLFFIKGKNNLAILADRSISYQVYYLLNDLDENWIFEANKPLMMEILYRNEKNRPDNILKFWEVNGFKEHLTRNNLSLTYKQKVEPKDLNAIIRIQYATSTSEAKYTATLFENDLDRYTGDLKSYEEILHFVKNKNVICAYEGKQLCGALQFELRQNNYWLGHIVVDSDFRGKGIANSLVNAYIDLNRQSEDTRYQLWVIKENVPAVKLYERFGFKYAGKTTVSMLKL